MTVQSIVKKNAYYDSVTLMLLSRELQKLEGVKEVLVGMGTDLNLELTKNLGLMTPTLEGLSSNDLFITAKFDEAKVKMIDIEAAFTDQINKNSDSGTEEDYQPPSLSSAVQHMPGANMVVISVPGQSAAAEVEAALDAGLHVMLFSDNVPVEDELRLKQIAVKKGLLVMGPDCGTAIINGVPLCFANAVRRGKIGVVGASGTGTQEVTVQIHKLGEGLSQVIGTGGRDLKEKIGGLMMIQSFQALIADPETAVIVLISKPPDPSVADKIYAIAKASPKPVVIDFIGGNRAAIEAADAIACISLEDAARKAVAVLRGLTAEDFYGFSKSEDEIDQIVADAVASLRPEQTELRALFTGGTLADETMKLLGDHYNIYSNIPLVPEMAIENLIDEQGHICLDLGEDQFTRGRPHPMIDPQTRTEFFKSHINGRTAVVLVDVVLGFGSFADPAGAVADSVREFRARLAQEGKQVVVIASVCGTELDSQNLNKSVETLDAEGVIVLPSNAQAARLTDLIFQRIQKGA
ncbi:MAG: acyl-CoA synthetase FdrA [Anaerolineaceae bacterium]